MYYDISLDQAKQNYWFLHNLKTKEGLKINEFLFQDGKEVVIDGELYYEIENEGKVPDFCFAGVNASPVVCEEIANEIKELVNDDVQILPVKNIGCQRKFFIINPLKIVDCIDMVYSQYMKFYQPPLPKHSFIKLIIDESKVIVHIFRPKNWEIAFIVSKEVKNILEKYNMDGIIFIKVTL